MGLLVLGGTAWLGRQVAAQALQRGHAVTCLARGQAGPVARGTQLVAVVRSQPDAYEALADRDWAAVVAVSWRPVFVNDALQALGERARHWTYISSGNVYASSATPGADKTASLLPATDQASVGRELYGPAKVVCKQLSADVVADRLFVARAGMIGGPGDARRPLRGLGRPRGARPEGLDAGAGHPGSPDAGHHVRDLVDWLLRCALDGTIGTYDAVGPVLPFGDWVTLSRHVDGHTGPMVLAPAAALLEQGVEEYMGEDSMAMWLVDPTAQGWSSRTGAAALRAGLRHRAPRVTAPRRAQLGARAGPDRAASSGTEPAAGAGVA